MATKVYLIRTGYPHWGAYSGINQFVKFLDRDMYQVDVQLVADNDEDFPIKNNVIRGCLRSMVQRGGMEWYKLSDLTAETRAFWRCLRNEVDIVHYLDGEHSAQFLPQFLKRIKPRRVKLVATFHQPADILDSLVIKDVISKLDCVTVVSPDQVRYFEPFIAADKIRVIWHGVDTDYFKPDDTSPRGAVFKCMTVGHYLRDFEAVRAVAERLTDYRDIEFHIVSSKVTGLDGRTNVVIHRGVDDATLLRLYQEADILFLPLLSATANNALLEGIACGLPVVSTDLSSVRTYLPGQETVLIPGNDPGLLAEAILHLFHNPAVAACMSRQARRRAEALSWRKIAPQYEALYAEVASL